MMLNRWWLVIEKCDRPVLYTWRALLARTVEVYKKSR